MCVCVWGGGGGGGGGGGEAVKALRKHAYSDILKISPPKTKFSD